MRSFRLSRRALLHGLGGVAVALPALEIMSGGRAARAATPPKRYVLAYCGISTGTWKGGGTWQADYVTPSIVGPGYDVKPALQSLADQGVAGDVSVVSGLQIPWNTGGGVPPGGRVVNFHGHSVLPQLTGMRQELDAWPTTASSDQIVADAIAGDTTHRLLTYRMEADTYGFGLPGYMSFRANGEPETPFESPRLAYESLFTGFTPPDPAEAALAQKQLLRRKSVLDLVKGDVERLVPRLGAWDRARMERHLDEIRELEKRIDAIPPSVTETCYPLLDPGDDPPVGDPVYTGEDLGYSSHANYSHEEQRAAVMVDLIHMAFACDLSRVATLQLNRWKSYLNMLPLIGVSSDLHELSHGGGSDDLDLARAISWHVGHYARLLAKLKGTPDGLGGTLLDHTAAVMTFEGGQGYDPEGGDAVDGHSTENMTMLIGGRAGGLVPGTHVALGNQKHPANVIVSAMNAVGLTGDTLGEVSGGVDALFG
jgi:hypothetical protein